MSTRDEDQRVHDARDPAVPGATFDPNVLAALRADLEDDAFVLGLAQRFLVETPGRIAELTAAAEEGDLQAIVSTAHLIKGSALTFGLPRLVDLCAALERSPLDPHGLVVAVAAEFNEAFNPLNSYLGDVRSGAQRRAPSKDAPDY